MSKYHIQIKLPTPARRSLGNINLPQFEIDGLLLSNWDSKNEGYIGNAWRAEATIEADGHKSANKEFFEKLNKAIPRVAMISQCYIEYILESVLIHKLGYDEVYLFCVEPNNGTGLSFGDSQIKALNKLCKNRNYDDFFYIWKDMVNCSGYSGKLLLIFSAFEALFKESDIKTTNEFREKVLGKILSDKIFKQNKGVRHRLVHGEYFDPETDNTNYFNEIYKKILEYFNKTILLENLIVTENIINVPRMLHGNKKYITLGLDISNNQSPSKLNDKTSA